MNRPDDGSTVLPENQVRQVVRLLSEALAPDDGRTPKCRRVLDGLSRLVEADGWFWVRSRVPLEGKPINLDYLYGGCIDDDQFARVAERMLLATGVGAEVPFMFEHMGKGEFFTAARPQMTTDDAWASDPTMAPIRRTGLDEAMYSWFPIDDGDNGTVWSGVWMFREHGRPAFTQEAACLLHVVMSQCAVLHAQDLDLSREPHLTTLTLRQRLVLVQLLEGHSATDAADTLGISTHTYNDHVKDIYRHFHVQSRFELMSQFIAVDCGLQDGRR